MHPRSWGDILSPEAFSDYGRKIFADELREEVRVRAPQKRYVEDVTIENDERGIPILPEEDEERPWNLDTKKGIIRDFVTAHYGTCLM